MKRDYQKEQEDDELEFPCLPVLGYILIGITVGGCCYGGYQLYEHAQVDPMKGFPYPFDVIVSHEIYGGLYFYQQFTNNCYTQMKEDFYTVCYEQNSRKWKLTNEKGEDVLEFQPDLKEAAAKNGVFETGMVIARIGQGMEIVKIDGKLACNQKHIDDVIKYGTKNPRVHY
jgi:hypothetical protein